MSAPSKLCIICNKGETSKKKLVNNPEMIETLITSINERISLGKPDFNKFYFDITMQESLNRKKSGIIVNVETSY